MKESLLTAWRTNNDNTVLLLKNLEEPSLLLRLGAKGRTLGEQLAHVHNVRVNWMEFVAKPLYDKSLLLSKDAMLSVQTLLHSFAASSQKIEKIIDTAWEKEGEISNFKAGLIPFISYLVSHKSHHRGNILLTMKQSGIKLTDELKWGLWDWGM